MDSNLKGSPDKYLCSARCVVLQNVSLVLCGKLNCKILNHMNKILLLYEVGLSLAWRTESILLLKQKL